VHDEQYLPLEAVEAGGSLALGARWRTISLRVEYHLLRGWSDPARVALSEDESSSEQEADTVYQTNFSFVAHGPRLALSWRLPWRVTLAASAWMLRYTFDDPDQFVLEPRGEIFWQGDRRDLKTVAALEALRPLAYGLSVALSLQLVDNRSSLDRATPVGQEYSRWILGGELRWRWPLL